MTDSSIAALIILDGFGCRDEMFGNAVKQANKPNFDHYWKTYPHNLLTASGRSVGLPNGQMGNSEVGHLNIGAGRIVYQSLTRINLSIEDGTFYEKEAFIHSMKNAREKGKALHLFGLLSDGGVHSHVNHLYALLKLAKQQNVKQVYVHAFLDGRDVGPKTAEKYIMETEEKMHEIGIGAFATISGRYYAMDRDKRWDRVKKAFEAIIYGEGPKYAKARDVLIESYQNGIYDEFVLPSIIKDREGDPVGSVEEGDAIIFYNFRPDRAIQLSSAFANNDFNGFDRGEKRVMDNEFVMLTNYSDSISGIVAFDQVNLDQTVGEVLSHNGKKQLRIAETEKYPHVTFFMSGGREETFPGEKRVLIDSPNVATYDLKPEMSVYEVTESLLSEISTGEYQAVILNFANPDMVGHSGKIEPTIRAIEAVDECLGKIVEKITELGGHAIITADHGNSDEVTTLEGKPMTAHTTNPVPVIITKEAVTLRDRGILADLSPTLLDLLNIAKPDEMTGKSLIKK